MSKENFEPKNPDFVSTVRESFARQGLLRHLGAELVSVLPGEVTIELPVSDDVSQQHGFVHAGAMTAIVDSACGYAALTLMPPGTDVLTIEYKVNFIAPAQGIKLIAIGLVMKPGRTVTVCRGDVFMVDNDSTQQICATMLATMIARHT
ncbi:MAG: PaaI family thioesterase [Chloroflexota bacterium]